MAVTVRRRSGRSFSDQETARLLEDWRVDELQVARRFRENNGLSDADLEDLYQEVSIELIARPYFSEDHLRNALRAGMRLRALRRYRDRAAREQILAREAPGLLFYAGARERADAPDQIVLAAQDRLIAAEFMSELSELERRVFGLLADGLGWRAAARALGIERNEARNAWRACERKRDRFWLLYETGRLCGFRAHTIRSLRSGQADSSELARRAYTHLQSCPRCRQAHESDGREFRRLFERDVASLLPLPGLRTHGHGLPERVTGLFARHQHLVGTQTGNGGVREQVVAAVASAGAAAKLAASVATVAVVAGGAVGVDHALTSGPHSHRGLEAGHHRRIAAYKAGAAVGAQQSAGPVRAAAVVAAASSRATSTVPRGASSSGGGAQAAGALGALGAPAGHRPRGGSQSSGTGRSGGGGFGYLGGQAGGATPPRAQAARQAGTGSSGGTSGGGSAGGGSFTP
jgi:DNA-directed RNA polymerase specialized sigma24 family protein